MKKTDKAILIEQLTNKFNDNDFIYLADSSTLTVESVNKLRRLCFEKGVEMTVVKNTLAKKAFEANAEEKGFEPLYEVLNGPTTVFISETANVPAKVIKEFRKTAERPILKAAYISSDVFIGDDQVDVLAALKSKEELIGDVIMLLQSPAKNVVSALKSGGSTIAGLMKALQERG